MRQFIIRNLKEIDTNILNSNNAEFFYLFRLLPHSQYYIAVG